jgi:hypothetical protein
MQPYAFTGDDPLNATDPLGLDSTYILVHGDGVPYYVGRSKYTPATQRERAHRRSGRMGKDDRMVTLDTSNLSKAQAKDVEEYAMGRLGTMAGPGSFPMNQRHEISPADPTYYARMSVAIDAMSGGGEPGTGNAFGQLTTLKNTLDSSAASNNALVPQYLRSQLWSPLGPNTMGALLGATTPRENPYGDG